MRTLTAALIFCTGFTLAFVPTTLPSDGAIHDVFPPSTVITETMRPAGGIATSKQDAFWRTGEQPAPDAPPSVV